MMRSAHFQPAVMAALCGCSRRTLERWCVVRFNVTPKRYAEDLQLRLALDLINEGWKNEFVARELYFSSQSHLCHKFAKFYGMPPQKFLLARRAPDFSI